MGSANIFRFIVWGAGNELMDGREGGRVDKSEGERDKEIDMDRGREKQGRDKRLVLRDMRDRKGSERQGGR